MSKLLKRLSKRKWMTYTDIPRKDIREILRTHKEKFDASFISDIAQRRREISATIRKYDLISKTILVISTMAYLKFDFSVTYNGVSIKNFEAFVPYAFIIYVYCSLVKFTYRLDTTHIETTIDEYCKIRLPITSDNNNNNEIIQLYTSRYFSNAVHMPLSKTFKSKKMIDGDIYIGFTPIAPAFIGGLLIMMGLLMLASVEMTLDLLFIYNSYNISAGLLSWIIGPLCVIKLTVTIYSGFVWLIPLPYRDLSAVNRLLFLDERYPNDTARILKQVESEFGIKD